MIERDLINIKVATETAERMPKSLQLMLELEKNAELAVAEIIASIERGETTLDAVIIERGIRRG